MAGVPWTPEQEAVFDRLARGGARDVADLVRRFAEETGRAVTRAAIESRLLRCGISARDVVAAHAVQSQSSPQNLDPPERNVKVTAPEPPVVQPPPPPVIPVGRELTVGLAGDLHDPEIDKPAWNAFLRWTADTQPDVLVLTEMVEWLSLSAHNGGNWGSRFDDDCASGRRRFAQIRSINPNAEIVVLEANHDTRLERLLAQRLPQLYGSLTVPRALGLDDLGIRWVPEEQSFRVGRLKVIHGHQLQPNPDKGMLPENACKRAIQRFGEPGWTVVFFHTHRRGYWAERHDSGVFEAVNLPCLRTLHPEWHRGAVFGHSHGFGIGHIGPTGQTNLYSVEIENGSFAFGGRRFAA